VDITDSSYRNIYYEGITLTEGGALMNVGKWCHDNIESTDILAFALLVSTTFLAYYGVGGEDLPKFVYGGIIGYLTAATKARDDGDGDGV
jgi:hypothetical protein